MVFEGESRKVGDAIVLTYRAELDGLPADERGARYQCVLVYLRHAEDPVPIVCQGSWEGRILEAPVGDGGFGYDPLFRVETHGCSSAELPSAVKNSISHRGQALAALVRQLEDAGSE